MKRLLGENVRDDPKFLDWTLTVLRLRIILVIIGFIFSRVLLIRTDACSFLNFNSNSILLLLINTNLPFDQRYGRLVRLICCLSIDSQYYTTTLDHILSIGFEETLSKKNDNLLTISCLRNLSFWTCLCGFLINIW